MAKKQGSERGRNGGRGGGRDNGGPSTSTGTSKAVPTNWPSDVAYLTTPVYAGIAPWQRTMLQTQPGEEGGGRGQGRVVAPLSEIPSIQRFGPSSLVEIRTIDDAGHPACGQRGLFAAQQLRAGSFLVPYFGVYHRGHVSVSGGGSRGRKESDYDLWLDRAADVAVDAAEAGNEARFVNDYRGTGKPRPNAEFREVWDPRRGERGMAVFVLPAGKRAAAGTGGIAKGDEILVSYGKGFWEMRQKEEEGKGEEKGEMEMQDALKVQQVQPTQQSPDIDLTTDYRPTTVKSITYARAAAKTTAR
ncbi:hypothetical protein CMQ_4209 [Grosmannia clavigera kw1407]|uniref:SET domain-containing protein n=1 Tax=Grosmannia clavigera (strain kw1407 / UAMH 11150) TaxID=655863 RepID=F0X9M2_GROCL|nr:uncharacterized protein CMQ_4209 [Grosmannia clavigera kw1407]EFX06140.1 hypothetical protein CMQ_4209 [Grosmannia clavigera kw1407]